MGIFYNWKDKELGDPESPGSRYHYTLKNKKLERFIVLAIIFGFLAYVGFQAYEYHVAKKKTTEETRAKTD